MAHEGTHGLLGRTRAANLWWARLALLPSMVPYTNFRRTHLLHHRFTNLEDKDPDHFVKPRRDWELPLRAIGRPHHVPRIQSMKDSQAFDFDGEYGRGYDELARQVIPAYEQIFRATAALFENELPSDARVLVVGSGTGTEVATFGAAQPGWTIIGVDPSAEMVRMTERRADELGLDDRVMIVHGFARDLPLTPPYDAATIINVLHFLEDDGDKADLLTSVAERTRSGGLLALVDLHGDPTSDEFRFLMKGWEGFMRHRGSGVRRRKSFCLASGGESSTCRESASSSCAVPRAGGWKSHTTAPSCTAVGC